MICAYYATVFRARQIPDIVRSTAPELGTAPCHQHEKSAVALDMTAGRLNGGRAEMVGIALEVRNLSTSRTTSGSESAPSFFITLDRWALMVFSLVPNSKAICLFSRPWAIRRHTSCSLGERPMNAV